MPTPMTRYAVNRLLNKRLIEGLVIRREDELGEETAARMKRLLSRAKAVFELMERYREAGYSLLLPGDELWPERLNVLGMHTPLFLFVRGNLDILNRKRIAVAGSRSILPDTAVRAQRLGQRLAMEGICVVAGGAPGVDHSAQSGALEADGCAIVVPARPAAEIMREYGEEIARGSLLMLCDTLPDEPFSPQKALTRNHTIYALGDAAVVAAAREGIGGSWRGAMDCLQEGWTPVFVPDEESPDLQGCRALIAHGARPMPADDAALIPLLFNTERQISLL